MHKAGIARTEEQAPPCLQDMVRLARCSQHETVVVLLLGSRGAKGQDCNYPEADKPRASVSTE